MKNEIEPQVMGARSLADVAVGALNAALESAVGGMIHVIAAGEIALAAGMDPADRIAPEHLHLWHVYDRHKARVRGDADYAAQGGRPQ